ncbi:MAG TPA: methyltransferase domain-containing protein [Nitrolancea sp.]
MVVDRSNRPCLLCGRVFRGRAFLCRDCAERYRDKPIPVDVRQRFYAEIDRVYPDWSNTYGQYNPPVGLFAFIDGLPRDIRVLEVGAGGGFTLERLRQMGFNRLAGLDLTESTLAAMRERAPDARLVAADAEALPFRDGSFDLLLSSDVVEHLPALEEHFAEAARLLTLDGYYLFKTPNRLMAQAYYCLRGMYDAYFWHPSMSSPGEIRSRLVRHNFTVRFAAAPHLTEAQLRKIPSTPGRRLARILPLGRLPLPMRPHLEVIAQKRVNRKNRLD